MEPVEPRMEMPFTTEDRTQETGDRSGSCHKPHEYVIDRRREKPAVDAIEHAAVAGNQIGRVLHACASLQQRLEEIADDAEHRDCGAQKCEDPDGRSEYVTPSDGHRDRRKNHTSDGTFNRFLWTDRGRQGTTAKGPASVVLR